MAVTTGTLAEGILTPEIFSKELLRQLKDYGVMFNCVNRDYEGEVKNQGDSVTIRQLGDVTVSTHDDTTPMTYEELTANKQTMPVDQAKDFKFLIKTIPQKQSDIKALGEKYLSSVKKDVANVKDAYLHALGIAGVDTDNQMGTTAITADTIYGILCDMFTKLSRANAIDADGRGADGKRPFLILPPEVVGIVRKSPEAIHATAQGDETIRKGTIIPNFAGFDIKQSTNVKDNSGFAILAGTTEGM